MNGFNDTSGYGGLGQGLGMLLGTFLAKRNKDPEEMQNYQKVMEAMRQRGTKSLDYFFGIAKDHGMTLGDLASQLNPQGLQDLSEAQDMAGVHIVDIGRQQLPQQVAWAKGMTSPGGAASLGSVVNQMNAPPSETGYGAPATTAFTNEPAVSGKVRKKNREAGMAMQQPYGMTEPEYQYKFKGAPEPSATTKEGKPWKPIYPTVWDPDQIIKTQSVFPELTLNEVEYLAASYPVGDEDSLNTTLRMMNEQKIKDKEAAAKGEKVEPAEERARKILLTGITTARTGAGMPEGVTLTDKFVSSKLTDYAKLLNQFLVPYINKPEMIGKYGPEDYNNAIMVWKSSIPGDINLTAVASERFLKDRLSEMAKVVITPIVGNKHPDDWDMNDLSKMDAILQSKYGNTYESTAEFIRDYLKYYPVAPKPKTKPAVSAPGTKGKVKAK